MIMKYHNHTMQTTNPRHSEEETQDTNSHMKSNVNKEKQPDIFSRARWLQN